MAFCGECGSGLPEGAKFCANCGAAVGGAVGGAGANVVDRPEPPVRPVAQPVAAQSRGIAGYILPAMVLIAVDEAAVVADAAGDRASAGTFVSATTLDSAFFSDPAGAAVRYAGPVRVSGVIATMVQPGPTPALSLEGRNRFNYMIVNFPEGYRTRLAPLAKGQTISVACDAVRGLAGTTILSGCLLD